MDFQEYIKQEKLRINKMTPKQKEYILSSHYYLDRLGIDKKDIELDLIDKEKANSIIDDIHEMRGEDLWEAYTHEW